MDLTILQKQIVDCRRCMRLREYCAAVAETKRRAYINESYWGRPVPSFGDPAARMLIVGLAPGAHGANRTGRMFTGDSSGDLLYRVLHGAGFASQPVSRSAADGLELRDAYITASAHCAPPQNKPLRSEIEACRTYLASELKLLPNVQVVVALGRIAFDNYLSVLQAEGRAGSRSAFPFGHNLTHRTGAEDPILISSYHPSQQNTSTGKLTERMLQDVFKQAKNLLES